MDGSGGAVASSPGQGLLATVLARAERLAADGLPATAAGVLEARREQVPPQEKAQVEHRLARYYAAAGSWGRAAAAARAALKAGVDHPEILTVIGEALREESKLEESRRTLVEALEKHPDHAPAKLALARVELRLGEAERAVALCEEYLRSGLARGESYVLAQLEHARALRAQGRQDDAASALVLALEEDPASVACLSELANVLYRSKRQAQAQFVESIYRALAEHAFDHEVEEKLTRSGREGLALSQRAMNLEREGRWLDAMRAHRLALELEPDDPRVRVAHAVACAMLFRPDEGKKSLEQAIAKGVEPSSGMRFVLGRLHLASDDFGKALEALRGAEAALDREGDSGGLDRGQAERYPVMLAIAAAEIEMGRYDAGLAAAAAARAIAPDRHEPDSWAGRAALSAGSPAKALESFDRALSLGGEADPSLALWRTRALLAMGRSPAEAHASLGPALRATPGDPEVLELLLEIVSRGTIDKGPSRDQVTQALGRAQTNKGQLEDLKARLRSTDFAASGPIYAAIGLRLGEAGSPDALRFLLLAAGLEPKDRALLETLLGALRNDKDVFWRLHFARRLLEIDADHPRALEVSATDYGRLQVRLDVAETRAKRLCEMASTSHAWRLLAAVQDAGGRRADALATLEEAKRRFPADEAIDRVLETLRR